jgi:STE24 endopeptidase
MKLIIWGGP